MVAFGIHLYILSVYSLNYPYEDDHRVYLDFAYNYINTNSLIEKFGLLFTPDNESRPFLIRISMLGELSIFHTINFKHILFLVNGYTFILVGVFLKKYRNEPLLQVALAFGLLNLCGWEMYFRNDVASYQLATISLSILAFYLLTQKLTLFYSFIFYLCFFILPFGSGVGFIAAFMILIYSLLKKTVKEWLILGIILAFQVFLYLYYASESTGTSGFFENVFKYKFELIWVYFIALGGIFQLFSNSSGYIIAGIFGAIAFAVCVYFILKTWKSTEYDFEKLVFIFMAGSLAIIVLNRYNYWVLGYESVLVPRYKLYGIVIFLLALTFIYKNLKTNRWKIVFSSGIVILYILWLLKAWHLLTLKNETQMMDVVNMKSEVIKPEVHTFVSTEKYAFLTKTGFFDADELYNQVSNKLKNSTVINPATVKINHVDFDPAFGSDWGGKKTILTKVELTGSFPTTKTYFIELMDNEGNKVFMNGFRGPVSVLKRLMYPKTKIDYLSKEIDLEYYKIKQPFTCKVFCIND